MHEAFIVVNNAPTHILTWGKWIEEDLSNVKDLVLFIPGNPGLPGFYTDFLDVLYKQLGERIPVWGVGHGGHELPSKYSPIGNPPLEQNKGIYNLKGQILHKILFIQKYIPKHVRLHLISHSIGSYMALELHDTPDIAVRIHKNYLLFPTVEHMAATSRGQFLSRIIRHLVPVILILVWIFASLPSVIQVLLIRIYLFFTFTSQIWCDVIIDFIQVNTIRQVFFLAMDEMDNVLDRNDRLIKENMGKLKLYYSSNDHWAPAEYCNRIKGVYPELDVTLCPHNYPHAFVLEHSKDVGVMLASWIQETL